MFHKESLILIVDDAQTTRSLIIKILRGIGYSRFETASNGEEALELIKKHTTEDVFDLVICDWHMPKMPGQEFLSRMRTTSPYQKVPFLMVTSENEMERVIEAVTLGVTEFIVKPFSEKTFIEKMAHCWQKTNSS